jgi:hypothetical protein
MSVCARCTARGRAPSTIACASGRTAAAGARPRRTYGAGSAAASESSPTTVQPCLIGGDPGSGYEPGLGAVTCVKGEPTVELDPFRPARIGTGTVTAPAAGADALPLTVDVDVRAFSGDGWRGRSESEPESHASSSAQSALNLAFARGGRRAMEARHTASIGLV